jgi:hypothetical protein
MSDDGKRFFQFPIACLSYPGTFQERIDAIISYAIVQCGERQITEMGPEGDAWIDRMEKVQPMSPDALLASAGGEYLRLTLTPEHTALRYQQMRDHIETVEEYGGSMLCRVELGLVLDTRDGKALSEREFSVLCAIYASIGAAPKKCISAQVCGRLAAGIYSNAAFAAAASKDRARILTPRQVRLTWRKLNQLRFFAMLTVGRRKTYFSHRLTQSELEDQLFSSAMYAATHQAAQAKRTVAFHERLAKAKAELGMPVGRARQPKCQPNYVVNSLSSGGIQGVTSVSP